MAFEELLTTASMKQPGKLQSFINGLDRRSRNNLEAALAHPASTSAAISRALADEGLFLTAKSVAAFRKEAQIARESANVDGRFIR